MVKFFVIVFIGVWTSLCAAQQINLKIQGMHCIACTVAVKKALNRVEGVQQTRVNFAQQLAVVSAEDTVSLNALREAVAKTGYRATLIP